jgi:hypothetical protein
MALDARRNKKSFIDGNNVSLFEDIDRLYRLTGTITPQQFSDLRRRELTGEQELQVLVLQQVFYTLVGKISVSPKHLIDDRIWLDDDVDWGAFSCAGICASLGFDQRALRQGIRRWRETRKLSELTTAKFRAQSRSESKHHIREDISLGRQETSDKWVGRIFPEPRDAE